MRPAHVIMEKFNATESSPWLPDTIISDVKGGCDTDIGSECIEETYRDPSIMLLNMAKFNTEKLQLATVDPRSRMLTLKPPVDREEEKNTQGAIPVCHVLMRMEVSKS